MDEINNDPRFAHIATDPKFRLMPKSKRKVKIDPRFQSVFTSKHFSHRTDVDKRGRPVLDVSAKSRHVMHKFYQLSDDESSTGSNEDKEVKAASKDNPSSVASKLEFTFKTTDSEINSIGKKVHAGVKVKRKQSEKLNSPIKTSPAKRDTTNKSCKTPSTNSQPSQEEDTSSESEDLSENDDQVLSEIDDQDQSSSSEEEAEYTEEFTIDETDVDHKWNELHADAPAAVESTHRLAVCNMDWDFVRAQDLFVLFKSFVPAGGQVLSVTIFPSEFGKERMAEEAQLGPREIRQQNEEGGRAADQTKTKTLDQQGQKRSRKQQEAAQTERLREYQLNRLRYYFAVVVCDSVDTAEAIYNECDGREYLLSSVRLDLRFIPNGMDFQDTAKDAFLEQQSILGYEPNKFNSTALCQAKVDVTWDETDFDRLSRRVASLQQKEWEAIVEENKYADLIAPPESDTDEEMEEQPDWLKDALGGGKDASEEDKIALYRKMLIENNEGEEAGSDTEKDMECVWQPGLKSSLEKKIVHKQKSQGNTGVVNDYLERKREKKKKKKDNKSKKTIGNFDVMKNDVDEMGDDVSDKDLVLNPTAAMSSVPEKKKKKKKKGHVEALDENDSSVADLELLVMDGAQGSTQVIQQGKQHSHKKKKRMKRQKLASEDGFQLDVSDPRFSAIFNSHHFHIDPSSPHFKKSKNMDVLVNEQVRGRAPAGKQIKPQHTESSKLVSNQLVESLKRKMKK